MSICSAVKTSFISMSFAMACVLVASNGVSAEQWTPTGPEGGEVRSLAYDPVHPETVFLGTSSGQLFCSSDIGRTWSRCGRLGNGEDYVIDHVLVDPHNSNSVYASVWNVNKPLQGELFHSSDGGKKWSTVSGLRGKSVRCIAAAASQPGLFLVGSLDGVFRSTNGGLTWSKISSSRTTIRNVESLAIDPLDSAVYYAGTRHLAWKTTDGGAHWRRLDDGMIDDSDVFTIILDRANPQILFAGACSGIYKSNDGGRHFERIQGMPFSARRTHVLSQSPQDPKVLYAGTTEGLWVSNDAGESWRRVTGPDVVVNDVLASPLPDGRILLATDRAGILAGSGGNLEFKTSNSGFTHRYISSLLVDKDNLDRVYLSVVNDGEYGGVFVSEDGGRHWTQRSDGLMTRDVFALQQGRDGAVLAGTDRGMFALEAGANVWKPQVGLCHEANSASGKTAEGILKPVCKINDVQFDGQKWFAATSRGLYTSDDGEIWNENPSVRGRTILFLSQRSGFIALVDSKGILLSTDDGQTWRRPKTVPLRITISGMIITKSQEILVASDEGVFRSRDMGKSWQRSQRGLPDKAIHTITYDDREARIFVIAGANRTVLESNDGGLTWHRGPKSGWPLRSIRIANGRSVAATTFDGVVVDASDDSRTKVPGTVIVPGQ